MGIQGNWQDESGHPSEKHCWTDRRMRSNHVVGMLTARVKEFYVKVNFH